MWFLVKATFWFSLVLVLLPFLDPSSSEKLEHGPKMEIGGTFSAANEAIQYISAICVEKPDVCEKGAETFVALGHRAREGARIAYEFLNTQFAEGDAAAPDVKVMTGTPSHRQKVSLRRRRRRRPNRPSSVCRFRNTASIPVRLPGSNSCRDEGRPIVRAWQRGETRLPVLFAARVSYMKVR